jgi:molecular chaperone GrpE
MVKGKNNFFGQKKGIEPENQDVVKENIVTGEGEDYSEKMSEPAGMESDEKVDETISGSWNSSEAKQANEVPVIDNEKELQLKVDELQDKYIRLMAEFDNFRRRTLKEKTELIKFAGEDILVSLLPVIDDFERGLQVMDKTTEVEPVKLGVQLIYNKFKDFLVQRGVKEVESLNKDFDVELHEALTKIPAPEEDLKGKVLDVVQKGYILNDKVIRYAKVVVGE